MTKKSKDAAFIKKISSITIGVGAKSKTSAPCPDCNAPIEEHAITAKLIALPVGEKPPPGATFLGYMPVPRQAEKPKPREEQSFSA